MKNEMLWKIDHSHSEISFKVIHLMITYVKGSFKTFDASIRTQGKDFKTAEIDLWIDASTIGTGDANRDYHLQGPDFLDAKNHRLITFRSDYVGKSDLNGNYELLGQLTILLTQTVLWMALLVSFAHYRITLIIAEILIWLAEGLLFRIIPASQLSAREAPLLSPGMNVTSFTLGLFLPV